MSRLTGRRISVLGAGTWGTALAILLNHNGHEVTIWSKFPEELQEMRESRKHRNLPGAELPETMLYESDLGAAMEGRDVLVLAVPSIFTRGTARSMQPFLREGQVVVSVAKGIEESTLMVLTDQIEEELPKAEVCCLSGPSHAEEVSRRIPTACVVGAHSRRTAEMVRDLFMSPVFRVYTSPDMLGMELGASIKNVIALAAGMADGVGYGDNTKAALITRGIAEISRVGTAKGAQAETFAGLTGIGDLIVTCASMHSRNRRAGILIGKGATADEAAKEVGQVVEGVYSARAAMKLAEKYGVSMPIVEEVNQILFENKPAAEAVRSLMERDPVPELAEPKWERD